VNSRPTAGPERQLFTRSWRRIAIQTAALFAIAIIALDAVTIAVVLDSAHNDARRQLDQAMNDPDAITNPPVDIVVYQRSEIGLRSSPGAPPAPIDPTAMANAVASPGPDTLVRRGEREYLVRTYRHNLTTTQLALDMSSQNTERRRLFMGLAAAGAAGMVLAGGLGALIARRAVAPLGHALARQQRFVADASHELRTPLTQLHTRAQLLEREMRTSADPRRMRDDVDQLVRGTRQLGEVVEELLVSASLRAEPQRYGPVDLHPLAVEAAEAERPRADQRRIELRVDAPADASYVVRGTESALRRVLASLVDNAMSHTPAAGQVTIELRRQPRSSVVEARVRDNGEGFDPDESARLFERFYRGAHGDGRRFGLGLSLVREVVVAHGGTVTATGAPDVGACFTVRLPAWSAEGGDHTPG
jgi:two-component system, OmpR family, sensor kinase